MASEGKHVFISYVSENSDQVDKLCDVLDAVNIPYWRDRSNLGPGDEWKVKIREAIRSGSMAFLACFSNESRARDKSYMNEELTIACEEWRLRPPGRTWLIPVRFDDGPVPEWDLGAGKTLSDLNYSDLFGAGYTPNTAQLVEKIKEVMGLSSALDPAIIRAAVGEAAAEERPALLHRLTKDMVRDPTREIELADLINEEVARVLSGMRDTERFPMQFTGGRNRDLTLACATAAGEYWRLVEPFCWSLQVAARWGSPDGLRPWARGIAALCAEALKPLGGAALLLSLRNIPSLMAVFVAAMAAGGQPRWDNFKALLIDNTVSARQYENRRLPIIDAAGPWEAFDEDDIPQLLAHAIKTGQDLETAQAAIDAKGGRKYKTAIAEWMHGSLRPLFDEQFPDDDTYDSEFDRTEVMLGILSEDLANVRQSGAPELQRRYFMNAWFGRSAWRSRRYENPVQTFADEQTTQGSTWPPLVAGLFGGSLDRATKATSQYSEKFYEERKRYL